MFHIVLLNPEIPPNTGNVIRLAANAGAVLHLAGKIGFDMSDRRLRRAGLDYREYAEVQTHNSLAAALAAADSVNAANFANSENSTDSVNAANFANSENSTDSANAAGFANSGNFANSENFANSQKSADSENAENFANSENSANFANSANCGGRQFAVSPHGETRFDKLQYRPGDIFVFGCESSGLPPEVFDNFPPDRRLHIPMRPGGRSMNLSNAVAVIVMEAWKQNNFCGARNAK